MIFSHFALEQTMTQTLIFQGSVETQELNSVSDQATWSDSRSSLAQSARVHTHPSGARTEPFPASSPASSLHRFCDGERVPLFSTLLGASRPHFRSSLSTSVFSATLPLAHSLWEDSAVNCAVRCTPCFPGSLHQVQDDRELHYARPEVQ